MEEKYYDLKLNEKEYDFLKRLLIETVLDYDFEKNQVDFDKKVEKDYKKYSYLHKRSNIFRKIINYMDYLKR